MAEGLLRHLSNDGIEAYSAGTHPSFVHPIAIQVMKEISIDISHHTSKSVEQFVHEQFDYVITVCDHAKEICPVFPGAKKALHMPFEDPVNFFGEYNARLEKFRRVRDQIKNSMAKFLRDNFPNST